jgi:hypothetical protein
MNQTTRRTRLARNGSDSGGSGDDASYKCDISNRSELPEIENTVELQGFMFAAMQPHHQANLRSAFGNQRLHR